MFSFSIPHNQGNHGLYWGAEGRIEGTPLGKSSGKVWDLWDLGCIFLSYCPFWEHVTIVSVTGQELYAGAQGGENVLMEIVYQPICVEVIAVQKILQELYCTLVRWRYCPLATLFFFSLGQSTIQRPHVTKLRMAESVYTIHGAMRIIQRAKSVAGMLVSYLSQRTMSKMNCKNVLVDGYKERHHFRDDWGVSSEGRLATPQWQNDPQ